MTSWLAVRWVPWAAYSINFYCSGFTQRVFFTVFSTESVIGFLRTWRHREVQEHSQSGFPWQDFADIISELKVCESSPAALQGVGG